MTLRRLFRMDRWLLSLMPVIVLLAVFGTGTTGCTSSASQHTVGKPERPYTMDDVAKNQHQVKLPSYVTADLQDVYEYAVAHPDKLQYMPCYCGCGLTSQHKNNTECYIAGVDKDGMIVFDNHASFCTVCAEITRDVQRLTEEGKSPQQIRAYVDETHGPKGPGTDTPKPPA